MGAFIGLYPRLNAAGGDLREQDKQKDVSDNNLGHSRINARI